MTHLPHLPKALVPASLCQCPGSHLAPAPGLLARTCSSLHGPCSCVIWVNRNQGLQPWHWLGSFIAAQHPQKGDRSLPWLTGTVSYEGRWPGGSAGYGSQSVPLERLLWRELVGAARTVPPAQKGRQLTHSASQTDPAMLRQQAQCCAHPDRRAGPRRCASSLPTGLRGQGGRLSELGRPQPSSSSRAGWRPQSWASAE